MMKWFGRSDVLQLVNDTSVDSSTERMGFSAITHVSIMGLKAHLSGINYIASVTP